MVNGNLDLNHTILDLIHSVAGTVDLAGEGGLFETGVLLLPVY